MKIISGFLKGRIIPVVPKAKYRPSTGKFKEALFSILTSGDNDVRDKDVLDLFSGSCSIGFEAISRGAYSATFIDLDRENLEVAKGFAKLVKIEDKTTFLNIDIANLRSNRKQYDIIFIDPPYNMGLAEKALAVLHKGAWLKPTSIIIVEVGEREDIDVGEHYTVVSERKYGASKMIILHPKED